MNRFVLVFLAISMTSIGATAINFLWIGAASADGNGKLIFVEVVIDGVGGVDGLDDAMSVTVSPDGKHLYVASTVDRSVAVFSRNSTTGVLTFVEAHKDGVGGVDGLGGAMSVTVSPDGNHVYVTGEYQDEMAVFSRNSTTGELTFVEVYKEGVGGVVGFDGVRSVMVSPDGKHLYTASHFDDALAVFSRNATSGKLTSVEIHKDGVGGVDGLDAARSVTVSPDGKHVYAAGEFENEVAVFSRDSTTGKLTFVEVVRDGVGGVDGLSSAYSIAISPGGTHVYVAGRYENAVAVFNRDSTIGKLTFVEVNKDGVGGVDGLDSIRSVTVSPDGYHIYAAGGYDDAIAVFNRDSTTGRLTFVETQNDSVGGVDGLNAAQSVTVSPDAKHIYVAGPHDNAVAVFSHNATTGSADLEVVKTGSPDPVAAGANLTYVITVTNNSTSTAATNVQIKDKLSLGTSLISAIATAGLCTGGTEITCTFTSLAAGASTTATIVVKVDSSASGSLTNVATTTADTLDSVISNNSFKAVTEVTKMPPVPSVSVWALAALSAVLLLTFSGRIRRRIMRRSAVGG